MSPKNNNYQKPQINSEWNVLTTLRSTTKESRVEVGKAAEREKGNKQGREDKRDIQ